MEYVIKRDGRKVPFDRAKVVAAVEKAMACTYLGVDRILSNTVAEKIEQLSVAMGRAGESLSIEDIQDQIEKYLMNSDRKDVAKEFICYRRQRQTIRENEKAHGNILEIIDTKNDYVNTENSNKNSSILSTQRDYMAGEVSKDLTMRLLLPKDIAQAHKDGIIHFHDADYFAQHMFNCDLINLEDMLQNGTVINGTLIERPHSFATACNIATQIMASCASNQYGGQSESLAHLAPFVDVSRKKIHKDVIEELEIMGFSVNAGDITEECVAEIVERRVLEEIKRGVQTIQYQINTLMTTNGQTPFVTIFMYIDEVPEGRTREDLVLIIKEVLRQRIQGTKNEKGAWITPAFPKLIYVLEEDNIHEDSKYWEVTKLAAQCTAKRMVPDYISEKIMLQNKVDKNGEGHCYTCMGGLKTTAHVKLEERTQKRCGQNIAC